MTVFDIALYAGLAVATLVALFTIAVVIGSTKLRRRR